MSLTAIGLGLRSAWAGTRRGVSIWYGSFVLVAFVGIGSLAVDLGRVRVADAELQAAADAAARYAATGLRNQLNGQSAAASNAQAALADSRVDRQAVTFDPSQNFQMGQWSASAKTFTPVNDVSQANAVRITLSHNVGSAVPLTLGSILGRSTSRVQASAIAVVDSGSLADMGNGGGIFQYWIPATSNPFLAGMPAGSLASVNNPANNPDHSGGDFVDSGTKKIPLSSGQQGTGSNSNASTNYQLWGDYAAKKSSPIRAGTVTVVPGATITFDGVNGGANNSNTTTRVSADGGRVTTNHSGSENGISNLKAPINSVVAVFLGPDQPSLTSAPAVLDFTSAASRNFHTLKPQLKQTFFIGDGRTSTGEVQRFVVPPGATRLYIGTMDGWEWNNNVGGFDVKVVVDGKIVLVR
jgi:Flp pilus assembly protein TadG